MRNKRRNRALESSARCMVGFGSRLSFGSQRTLRPHCARLEAAPTDAFGDAEQGIRQDSGLEPRKNLAESFLAGLAGLLVS